MFFYGCFSKDDAGRGLWMLNNDVPWQKKLFPFAKGHGFR
jgi:hypothetical protein